MEDTNLNPNFTTRPELISMSKDMNFVAIFIIIYGAVTCLSIIGMIIGIPIIFAALRLKESAEAFKHFGTNTDQAALNFGFEKLANAFRIVKILIIIGLIFYALLFIAVFTLVMPFITQIAQMAR